MSDNYVGLAAGGRPLDGAMPSSGRFPLPGSRHSALPIPASPSSAVTPILICLDGRCNYDTHSMAHLWRKSTFSNPVFPFVQPDKPGSPGTLNNTMITINTPRRNQDLGSSKGSQITETPAPQTGNLSYGTNRCHYYHFCCCSCRCCIVPSITQVAYRFHSLIRVHNLPLPMTHVRFCNGREFLIRAAARTGCGG